MSGGSFKYESYCSQIGYALDKEAYRWYGMIRVRANSAAMGVSDWVENWKESIKDVSLPPFILLVTFLTKMRGVPYNRRALLLSL